MTTHPTLPIPGFPYTSFDPIVVATTHLLFSPKRGDIKLAQLGVIFAELDWISRKRNHPPILDSSPSPPPSPRQLPIIVCGDMNFEPFCPIFDFVVDGSCKYDGVNCKSINGNSGKFDAITRSTLLPPTIGITEQCRKSIPVCLSSDPGADSDSTLIGGGPHVLRTDGFLHHFLNLKSAYHMDRRTKGGDGDANAADEDAKPEYEFMTTHHDRAAQAVDYIFFNESPKFKLLGTSPIPKIGSVSKIPNEIYGSDHFSIAASFSLRAEEKFYEF